MSAEQLTTWHRVDRGDDTVWVGRRAGAVVAVCSHLAGDVGWHPATIRDGGRRYDLPAQPRLELAMRYAELVNGDYWPRADDQLELLATAEPAQLELPSPGFMRASMPDPCAGFRDALADQYERHVDDSEGDR